MDDVEYGHYTTISGVMGILTSESLWATNIKFLNDEHEFQHALDLIKELLPTSRISREEPNNPVHNSFITTVTEKIDALDTYRCDSVFTLSFTEETDLLSQWRGYCPSNNGYCLVIDTPKLYESLQGHFDSVRFVKCVYDLDQKKSGRANGASEALDTCFGGIHREGVRAANLRGRRWRGLLKDALSPMVSGRLGARRLPTRSEG
jgi:hypothetical protein